MAKTSDPTARMREAAAAFPEVVAGTSCNQGSFKTKHGAFLFVGPGKQGEGFKAMFRLVDSLAAARKLAAAQPDRFEVGTTGWVTARFSAAAPLPMAVWKAWLRESYELAARGRARAKG